MRPYAAMLSVFLGVVVGLAGVAQADGKADKFQKISDQEFVPARGPLGVQPNMVHVVVKMRADSVARVHALTGQRPTGTELRAVESAIASQHASVEPHIRALGGKVLARFSHALNGVKVEIDRRQIPSLLKAPGVVAVLPVRTYKLNNQVSVPFIGAPGVWGGLPGFRGEGVKIAIVDTGIDYTHADFGGPGTVDAFNAAKAKSTVAADPALFGPNASKVKGGIDLVGDDYNADNTSAAYQPVPHPDPNPLDCNGHGSHVSGTAAGYGVGADGKTYPGPYNASIYTPGAFLVGPGVAPKADLYAVRVFGCAGSTNVVVDAIDWAVKHDMDVISMSLGSDFGPGDSADAEAASNAVDAGIIVVAASGNAGPAPYITSSPASGNGVISVAATDSTPTFPGATLAFSATTTIKAQNSNNGALNTGAVPVVVLKTSTGAVSLGCTESEYANGNIAGKLVVVKRGTCNRILRAQYGFKYGAAAVAMINSSAGYPPYEGDIPACPFSGATGTCTATGNVTIPFFGVLASDAKALTAATTATETAISLANPGFEAVASFSSGGPRYGDSAFKPSVTAPGVSVKSVLSGSGNWYTVESGTSMATPHVAGVAALVRQAHPYWSVFALRAAILETADPGILKDYAPRLEGSGVVQPAFATATQAVAFTDCDEANALSFGFADLLHDFHDWKAVTVKNHGSSSVSFNVTSTAVGGQPHTVKLSRNTVSVGPHGYTTFYVGLDVPAATAGDSTDFREVAGYVTLAPATSKSNNGASLRLPYYLVPAARSNLYAFDSWGFGADHPDGRLFLSNFGGVLPSNPDVYAWGLFEKPSGVTVYDTRAVGVQTFPISATDNFLVFAVNGYQRWSTAAAGEFDILIDSTGDGKPDYDLFSADYGYLTTGSYNGQVVSALLNLSTGKITKVYGAGAPTDSSIIELAVAASDIGVTSSNPIFSYSEQHFSYDGSSAATPGSASFNVFAPAISNALVISPLAPNTWAKVPVSIDPTQWATTPAKGLMVVDLDTKPGRHQAQLIRVDEK